MKVTKDYVGLHLTKVAQQLPTLKKQMLFLLKGPNNVRTMAGLT